MTGYRIEPNAKLGLDEIYDYSVARWDVAQADEYIGGLFVAFQEIADRQVLWRRLPAEYDIDGYSRTWRSHIIYWTVQSDGQVAIVSILHRRMHEPVRLREIFGDAP